MMFAMIMVLIQNEHGDDKGFEMDNQEVQKGNDLPDRSEMMIVLITKLDDRWGTTYGDVRMGGGERKKRPGKERKNANETHRVSSS